MFFKLGSLALRAFQHILSPYSWGFDSEGIGTYERYYLSCLSYPMGS